MSKRTQSQVGKMSRRKGKSFERWVARYFTQWTGLKWETTRNSGRTDLKGDIYCVSKPDLPLVVECKDDKRYSVHAMLKPTKAWTDMIKEVSRRSSVPGMDALIFIVKNETGIWFNYRERKIVPDSAIIGKPNKEIMSLQNRLWFKLENVCSFWFTKDVKFDNDRMDSVSNEG